MDENKNYNEAEEIEEAEAVAEETAEAEEAVEAVEVPTETAAEIVPAPEDAAAVKKSSKTGAIIAVVVAVVVIAAAIITSQIEFNKYNKMGYIDISGQTIGDIIKEQGITLDEFLETYSLPEDMPASTTESAAYYNIPTGKVAEMYGMDFDTLKAALNLGDEVTAETTWGEAEGMVKFADYIGEENVDSFKAQYGLGDEITGDTPWKEIRPVVDQMQKDAREAQELAEKEAADEQENEDELDADDTADELDVDSENEAEIDME